MTVPLASSLYTPPANVLSNTTPPQLHPTGKAQDRSDIDAAVEQGDVHFLVLALQCRSRATQSDDPVRQAINFAHPGALELLLRSGYPADADPGRPGKQILRPLRMLVEAGFTSKECDGYKMAELLLQYGSRADDVADADGPTVGMSLLGLASQRNCVLGAELLLSYGADPNRISAHGKTPLHIACEKPACSTWQPLNMLPMFPELQSFGASAELLDVDIMGLPSLQGVFGDTPPVLPATMPSWGGAELGSERPMLPAFSSSVMLGAWSPFEMPGEGYQKPPEQSLDCRLGDLQDPLEKMGKIVELLLRSGANACARDDSGQTPADKLPTRATNLRSKLQRAEARIRQQDFVSACWPLQRPACHAEASQRSDRRVAKPAAIACLSSSDAVDVIASFL